MAFLPWSKPISELGSTYWYLGKGRLISSQLQCGHIFINLVNNAGPRGGERRYFSIITSFMFNPGLRIRTFFDWIRIRKISTGSGSVSVLRQCKVVKTKEKIFKNLAMAHFQVNFSIFSDKNNHHSNIRRNMIMICEKFRCLN